jgi:hypothetical protein
MLTCCVFQLRSYLTEVLLDQMPVLSELQRYLEQLSIMDPPAVKSELIIEQVVILTTVLLFWRLPASFCSLGQIMLIKQTLFITIALTASACVCVRVCRGVCVCVRAGVRVNVCVNQNCAPLLHFPIALGLHHDDFWRTSYENFLNYT